MVTLAIEWMPFLTGFLVLVFVVVSVLMILTVLIQRPAGGGLSGAFGSGAGSGQTAFGTKTGDALTIATITMFVMFLLFAIILNFMARPKAAEITPAGATAPATTPAGAPAATNPPAPTPDAPATATKGDEGAPPAQPSEPPPPPPGEPGTPPSQTPPSETPATSPPR